MPTAKKAVVKKAAKRVPAAKKAVVKRASSSRPVAPIEAGPLGKTGRYHLEVSMNGEVFDGRTDTIARSLQALKPVALTTKMIVRASIADQKDGKVVEGFMLFPKARRIFNNSTAADIYEKFVKMSLGDING